MRTKLLVVDDEPDARGLLDYALSGAGFAVTLAGSGGEAVRLARLVRPDLILLDIMLPDIDGFTVTELLRRHPVTAGTPVVLLSAHGGIAVQARGAECGVQHCLIKSVALEQIIASLHAALNQRVASLPPAGERTD